MSTVDSQSDDQVEEISPNNTESGSHGGHDASGEVSGSRQDDGTDVSVIEDTLDLVMKISPRAADLLLENTCASLTLLEGHVISHDCVKYECKFEWSSWWFRRCLSWWFRRWPSQWSSWWSSWWFRRWLSLRKQNPYQVAVHNFLHGLCTENGMDFARGGIQESIEEEHNKSRPRGMAAGDTHFTSIKIDLINDKYRIGEYTSFGRVWGFISVEDVVNERGVQTTNFFGELQASALQLKSNRLQWVDGMTDEQYEKLKKNLFDLSLASMRQTLFGDRSFFVQDTGAEQNLLLNQGPERENSRCREREDVLDSFIIPLQQ